MASVDQSLTYFFILLLVVIVAVAIRFALRAIRKNHDMKPLVLKAQQGGLRAPIRPPEPPKNPAPVVEVKMKKKVVPIKPLKSVKLEGKSAPVALPKPADPKVVPIEIKKPQEEKAGFFKRIFAKKGPSEMPPAPLPPSMAGSMESDKVAPKIKDVPLKITKPEVLAPSPAPLKRKKSSIDSELEELNKRIAEQMKGL